MQCLRFVDLRRLGIVNNRVTLRNWIRDRGFPSGKLIGPNSRAWTEAEVQKWLRARPSDPKPVSEAAGKGRPRKSKPEDTAA